MKKFFSFLVALLAFSFLMAQAPEQFGYQAVLRDAAGDLIANTNVGMQISILEGGINGTVVYAETHAATTSANGLVTLEIGKGTPVAGAFSSIDWGNGTYFVKSETDPGGGSSYTIGATSPMGSVPFALYSDRASTSEFANTASLADSSSASAFAWNSASRIRSIAITPGMISQNLMGGGVALGALGFRPCIDLPEGGNFAEFHMSIPVPTDYRGTDFRLRVLYTSADSTGDFDVIVAVRGANLGEDLTPFVGGITPLFPAPISANFLAEGISELRTNNVNANTRLLQVLVRRRSTNPADTSTGTLKILGMVLEYED